jgi:transaldolase
MRPQHLKSKIFLDGGDPDESKEFISMFGFLDGQTTNPSLISKNPVARARMERGEKFSTTEILDFYREVVRELSVLIPDGSVSVEVYADSATTAGEMLKQAEDMFSWIPNAHIKFPTTHEGLKAAEQGTKNGLRANMTLCFTQEQAAAVYAATKGAKKGDVFVSPFVGRLDDRGESGMDLIANILRMYRGGDGHVEVLTASVRTMDHLMYALNLGSDIITAPFTVLKEWGKAGLKVPAGDYVYDRKKLTPIRFLDLDLAAQWREFHIRDELTDKGQEKFAADWNALIRK